MQAQSRLTLEDGTVVSACDRCKETWKISKKDPPCETCRVELMEENQDAAEIFMLVRGQIISLEERVVDLSIPAVKIIMDQHGVKNQRECMAKIFRTFHYFLNKQRKECE